MKNHNSVSEPSSSGLAGRPPSDSRRLLNTNARTIPTHSRCSFAACPYGRSRSALGTTKRPDTPRSGHAGARNGETSQGGRPKTHCRTLGSKSRAWLRYRATCSPFPCQRTVARYLPASHERALCRTGPRPDRNRRHPPVPKPIAIPATVGHALAHSRRAGRGIHLLVTPGNTGPGFFSKSIAQFGVRHL